MLYSYLLTRTEFKVGNAPETASSDKLYAYEIYTDMLLLLLEFSGISARSGKLPMLTSVDQELRDNLLAQFLYENEEIKALMRAGGNHLDAIATVIPTIFRNEVAAGKRYADYKKGAKSVTSDVRFFVNVLNMVISRSEAIKQALREEGNFSSVGFNMGVAMAIDTLNAYAESVELYEKSKEGLAESLDKAYDLYLSLFALIVDLTKYQQVQQDKVRNRHLATEEDRNPNTKLADNLLAKYLVEQEDIVDLMDNHNILRIEFGSNLMESLLASILESDLYKKYIEKPRQSLADDAEFWREALRTLILDNDDFVEFLESSSLYWNDDLYIMGTFVLKTLRRIAQSNGRTVELLPQYKDEEDKRFGPELFTYAAENYYTYIGYINKFTTSTAWDLERQPFMDVVIMVAAIAEGINFPKIPVPATVNEYVDIAANYSTDRSGNFVNAMLRNIFNYLIQEGIINK